MSELTKMEYYADAVREISQLMKECDRLRADLCNPPPDVQEKVIQMLNLVSADALKAIEARVKRLEEALDKLLVHSIEFYNDWKKGDFDLPKLAQLDMKSMAEQFPRAKQALAETEGK